MNLKERITNFMDQKGLAIYGYMLYAFLPYILEDLETPTYDNLVRYSKKKAFMDTVKQCCSVEHTGPNKDPMKEDEQESFGKRVRIFLWAVKTLFYFQWRIYAHMVMGLSVIVKKKLNFSR